MGAGGARDESVFEHAKTAADIQHHGGGAFARLAGSDFAVMRFAGGDGSAATHKKAPHKGRAF
jgi:hypothetical protein